MTNGTIMLLLFVGYLIGRLDKKNDPGPPPLLPP